MLAEQREKSSGSEPVIPVERRTKLQRLFSLLKLPYHYGWALLGALMFGFPSRKIQVVAVTGTKGKSSVVELVNSVLEAAGFKTALASTIHFKIGDTRVRNLHKMTMPGRFFLQKFLRQAMREKCDYAVIEMTSEGARQFRHKFIFLNALIFTNLTPEHIESHGSYENYIAAKVSLAKALKESFKQNKILVVNADEKEAGRFLEVFPGTKVSYSKNDASNVRINREGITFSFGGTEIHSKLKGEFNLYNMLAAAALGKALGIALEAIKKGIEKVDMIKGRVEEVTLDTPTTPESPPRAGGEERKQNFSVIVDYAHTPDSLEKLYQAFPSQFKICILGNTGGGRDKGKRPAMAEIAGRYCDEVILTNEDPYDEDPETIIREMAVGIKGKEPHLIMNRREAIRFALQKASKDDVVLISGKGTDPYIMGPNGSKEVWDDATVVKEELQKILSQRNP